jgi:transcriptional regulator with XRE-family HTH domain
MNRRQIVRGLATLRNSKNITQEEIAKKMECAQSRVSKIENGLDDDLRISDIAAYLKVLDYTAEINLLPSDMTIVDEIKFYACRMKQSLDKLTHLANKDDTIQKGVAKFHIEALVNLIELVRSSARKLPKSKNPMPKIRLSFIDEEIMQQTKKLSISSCESETTPV